MARVDRVPDQPQVDPRFVGLQFPRRDHEFPLLPFPRERAGWSYATVFVGLQFPFGHECSQPAVGSPFATGFLRRVRLPIVRRFWGCHSASTSIFSDSSTYQLLRPRGRASKPCPGPSPPTTRNLVEVPAISDSHLRVQQLPRLSPVPRLRDPSTATVPPSIALVGLPFPASPVAPLATSFAGFMVVPGNGSSASARGHRRSPRGTFERLRGAAIPGQVFASNDLFEMGVRSDAQWRGASSRIRGAAIP